MKVRKGIPVSPGVAIAPAVVLGSEHRPVPRRVVPAVHVERELRRLDEAVAASAQEVQRLREHTATALGKDLANIFGFHLQMLADSSLMGQIRALIEGERVTAEHAVYAVLRQNAQVLGRSENRYLRERVDDLWDLERRLVRHLIGEVATNIDRIDSPAAVVAHDLTPSQTVSLDRDKVRALAMDAGGRTSHTAILAHALGIPAVVGLEDLTGRVTGGETIIVDGNRGLVVIDPDAAAMMQYREEISRQAAFADTLGELRELPAVTRDGVEIELLANIEFPEEVDAALANGAAGVGLYRTEFLFLAGEVAPTEEEQHEKYVDLLRRLDGRPLTIRTLDLGADKVSRSLGMGVHIEPNPFLGVRSIRLCLQNLPLFKSQLRAILRASVHGPVSIMFPLISSVTELRQAKMVLCDVREDLAESGVPFREDIPVGMMVEVPSAAVQATTFAKEADFFSIGTNDLIQYTVAVDRSNERIASLYSGSHPAVLQLVRAVVRAAQRKGRDVSLCGEMGGEPEFTMLLLGLGLRTFSITPPAIPEVKRIIRHVSMEDCQRVARKALRLDTDREVYHYLVGELNRISPDVLDGRSIGVA